MADVTISQLTQGIPSGGHFLPFSNGSSTLGVPASAILQNAGNVGIGTSSPNGTLAVVRNGGNGIILQSSASSPNVSVLMTANYNNTGRVMIGASSEGQARPTLSFVVGDEERMLINSGGAVTKPFQPAFRATGTATGTTYQGGAGVVITLPYNTELFDRGNCFDPSTYKFTAPVTGVYYFYANFLQCCGTANSNTLTLQFSKNDDYTYSYGICRAGTSTYPQTTLSLSTVVQLNAGDTFFPQAEVGSGSFTLYMGGGHGIFCGYLIG